MPSINVRNLKAEYDHVKSIVNASWDAPDMSIFNRTGIRGYSIQIYNSTKTKMIGAAGADLKNTTATINIPKQKDRIYILVGVNMGDDFPPNKDEFYEVASSFSSTNVIMLPQPINLNAEIVYLRKRFYLLKLTWTPPANLPPFYNIVFYVSDPDKPQSPAISVGGIQLGDASPNQPRAGLWTEPDILYSKDFFKTLSVNLTLGDHLPRKQIRGIMVVLEKDGTSPEGYVPVHEVLEKAPYTPIIGYSSAEAAAAAAVQAEAREAAAKAAAEAAAKAAAEAAEKAAEEAEAKAAAEAAAEAAAAGGGDCWPGYTKGPIIRSGPGVSGGFSKRLITRQFISNIEKERDPYYYILAPTGYSCTKNGYLPPAATEAQKVWQATTMAQVQESALASEAAFQRERAMISELRALAAAKGYKGEGGIARAALEQLKGLATSIMGPAAQQAARLARCSDMRLCGESGSVRTQQIATSVAGALRDAELSMAAGHFQGVISVYSVAKRVIQEG